jgi:serine/threonine protein kinase
MSGFVYKVLVGEEVLIKKEIPGPDTIEEFLYEVNALSALRFSKHVIRFYGLVVDDQDQYVKGLLISYANQGALIDVIFDHRQESIESGRLEASIPWPRRVKWARQVVEGLSDIHESGFVQGDFTLSNIVIDDRGDAKIIDINRRGCPVGWEPPEATPLIESNQRISMYIGVKSDLFQLGMVLWGLAMEDDEPEAHQRPLILNEEASNIPEWYRQMTEICLSKNPRMRMQASSLLSLFPADDGMAAHSPLAQNYLDPYGVYTRNGDPSIRTVSPTARWPYDSIPATYDSGFGGYESSFNDPVRGRSPPRHFPGSLGAWDAQRSFNGRSWSHSGNIASYSDVGEEYEDHSKSATPTTNRESSAARNRPIDEAKDVVSGHEATIIEEVHDADVGDGTLKNPIPASEDGDVADVADVSSRAVDHLAEETRTVEDSTKVETGPQVGQETMPVLTIGVETCSEEGKNSIVGCNEKASCCVSSVADPGNTEPDVQIDSGAGIQGLQFETDASGVAAEDAELTGSAKPTAPVVETADIDGTKIASTAEDTNCDSKKDDSAAEAASELPLSEEPPQPSAQPASSPSVAKVPDALTGVGAAYDIEHPNLSKITTELEEELHLMDTTAGVPAEATTGTTDLDN